MKFKDVVDNLNILKLDGMANCLSEYVDVWHLYQTLRFLK